MSLKFRVGEVVVSVLPGATLGKRGVVLSVNDLRFSDLLTHEPLPILVRLENFSPSGHGSSSDEFCFTESQLVPENINGGSYSKATTTNPKDLLGSKKVSITKLPMAGVIHGAHAMMDGARKYGPFNWREKDVIASIYYDAAFRHLAASFEREEIAEDSLVDHLGHVIACCSIILDARENGNLIDDRPNAKTKDVIKNLLDRLSKQIQAKQESK